MILTFCTTDVLGSKLMVVRTISSRVESQETNPTTAFATISLASLFRIGMLEISRQTLHT